MRIEVVTIGGEILCGRIADGNFLELARSLGRFGVAPQWHSSVPDEPALMAEAISGAVRRADVVIITGGLGATPDDRTRQVVADLFDRPLAFDAAAWGFLQKIFDRRKVPPPESARVMAQVPRGAAAISNPVGLAPALHLREGEVDVVLLPGVPSEMRAFAERFVLPLIERRLGDARGQERVLRTAGVSETVLAESVGHAIPAGCELAYLPHYEGVDLRFTRSAEARTSEEEFEAWVEERRARIDDSIYGTGTESLASLVGARLLAQGGSLSVAESLTGGAISASIVSVAGASRYFLGSVVAYDNAIKERWLDVPAETLSAHGAVSAPTVRAMAEGVRARFGTAVGVATSGIAGPDGGSAEKPVGLVYFGLADASGVVAVRRQFPGGRPDITARSVGTALYLLWRRLVGRRIEGEP